MMATMLNENLLGWVNKPHSKKEINELVLLLQTDETSLLFLLKIIRKTG